MIVVTATVWPQGNLAQAYEILNVTINNTSSPTDQVESYMAHVLTRPKPDFGIVGYEADVEVREHSHNAGFTPLLMSVLAGAHADDANTGFLIPPSRSLARLVLQEMHEFEERLKARA